MPKQGYLEVIAGPMYSGKTEELIRQVRSAKENQKTAQAFKHSLDKRYGAGAKIYAHTGETLDANVVSKATEILRLVDKKTQLVAIDEAQWFGAKLVPVVENLLMQGKHVLVAGLAMTFDRQPFAPIPTLMAMADKVTKRSAKCAICGKDAVYHKRIVKGEVVNPLLADPALVGTNDAYEPRCRLCFSKKP